MDLLTKAANTVFKTDIDAELSIPITPTKGILLTPKKGEKPVFVDITNTISPAKFENSPLRTLLTAPTFSTPKTKSHSLLAVVSSSGKRNVSRGSTGKSVSCPSSGNEVGTPKNSGICSLTNVGSSGKSPLTPMTNLKLLTRIASMEESLSTCSKKSLFGKENDPYSYDDTSCLTTTASSTNYPGGTILRRYNSECLRRNGGTSLKPSTNSLRKYPTSDIYPVPSSPGNLVLEGIGRIPSVDETIPGRAGEVSRKDKSLGLLSEKFLEQFPLEVSCLETPRRLVIDEVAVLLGTERRRVYDIINVLESLNMACRVQKNMYQWTGKLHLEETLGRLKALGEKYDIATQLQAMENEGKDFKIPSQIKLTRIGENERLPDSKREKSLSILCQKFIMILLVSPSPHIISLDTAVRLLVGEVGEDGERLRTRGRRLYDIANVLTSLGLVYRIPGAKSFKYVGPVVQSLVIDDDTFGIRQKNSLLRSRNVSNMESIESISNFGDHEVTPSDVVAPVQKRGRPRKLSTAFTTTTLPAPKRSKLQRTQSEEVISHQSQKITRNLSLHDICQVAEIEREKLLKEQQMCRSRSCEGTEAGFSRNANAKLGTKPKVVLPNSDFRPIPPEPCYSSILHRRLTKRAKVPVALTFERTEKYDPQGKDDVYQRFKTSSSLQSPSVGNPSPAARQAVNIIRPICSANQKSDQCKTKVATFNNKVPCKVFNQSRVVPISTSGTQVIKVITKTCASREKDASTIMTVFPADRSVNSTVISQSNAGNLGGSFQRMSEGSYMNGKRITVTTSKQIESTASNIPGKVSEAKSVISGNPLPFVIYTVPSTEIDSKILSRTSETVVRSLPPQSSKQLGPVIRWETVPSGLASLTSAPLLQGSGIAGNHLTDVEAQAQHMSLTGSGSWQPSPNGSSTDSELEQIFGDTFNFSRPRVLVQKTRFGGADKIQPHSANLK
ncbi:positive regulation of DNA endoreduplication [Halocaridina rubra]|uniref:Positive regulation of DNA endoreduplication n=1 Tax=Halocaridina rubra TaxID=373956 RepID=A0AAN9A9Q7_HALRR